MKSRKSQGQRKVLKSKFDSHYGVGPKFGDWCREELVDLLF